MTEDEWLSCADLRPMVKFLKGRVSDRKLRLFTCALCLRAKRAEDLTLGTMFRQTQEYADNPTDGSLITAWRDPSGFAYPENAYRWAVIIAIEGVVFDYLHEETATALLRHIIGNPFHSHPPLHIPATVRDLAESAYQQNRTAVGPLYDALLDAGLTELAEHFAAAEECHPKGCWALDALTGRA